MTSDHGLIFQLKKLLSHGVIYGIGSVSSRVVGFLLLPLYTYYLSPSDYGTLQLVYLTVESLSIVISMRLAVTIFRFYYESKDEIERNTVISSALLSVLIVATIILAPLFFLSPWLAKIILSDSNLAIFFYISIISLWMSLSTAVVDNYIQLREKSVLYVSLSLSRLFAMCILNIYFIAYAKIGVVGILISSLIVDSLSFFIMIPLLLKIVGVRFSLYWLRKMLRFGVPLVPSSIANTVIHASDRYFIKAYFSLAETGIYTLAYKMGNSIHSLFYVSFSQIWNARRFAIFNETAEAPLIYAKVCTYLISLMAFVGLGMSLFAKDVIHVMSPEIYWEAARIMPAVILCYVIYAIEDHISTGIYLSKKTERYSLMKILSGVINIILNFILIPKYGMYGAVCSTLLTFLIFNIGLYCLGRGLYHIPFEWGRLSLVLLIFISFYFFSLLFTSTNIAISLITKMIIWFSCPIFMWVVSLVRDDEKKFLRELVTSKYLAMKRIKHI